MAVEPEYPKYVDKRLVASEKMEQYFGLEMLCSVDHSQFGELLSGIQNYYVKGNNKYINNTTEAYNTLNHYIRDTK